MGVRYCQNSSAHRSITQMGLSLVNLSPLNPVFFAPPCVSNSDSLRRLVDVRYSPNITFSRLKMEINHTYIRYQHQISAFKQTIRRISMTRFSLFGCLVLLLLVVTVIPVTASPAISSISPSTAPNNGDVTVRITGTGFNSNSSVFLVPRNSTKIIYGTPVSWSPTSITWKFSFNGEAPGQYDVWVNSPFTSPFGTQHSQDVGELPKGFQIYQGTGTAATTMTLPIPTNGSISITSIPSGANIYLDNEYKGLTTLTMKNVENGNHLVIVRLNGYQDWTQNVVVLGNSTSLFASLVATPATTTATTTAPALPTNNPPPVATAGTTSSPVGIEAGIIATISAALLVVKRK
jgi:hypothetical protein